MAILSAENNFKRGLMAIVNGDFEEASRCFRRAIDIQQQRVTDRPEWRYLSYYGLSMAKAYRPDGEAIEACRMAADGNTINPDLQLNLGRVYRLAGKRRLAEEAFARGLEIAPEHPFLREEMRLIETAAPGGANGGRMRTAGSMRWAP